VSSSTTPTFVGIGLAVALVLFLVGFLACSGRRTPEGGRGEASPPRATPRETGGAPPAAAPASGGGEQEVAAPGRAPGGAPGDAPGGAPGGGPRSGQAMAAAARALLDGAGGKRAELAVGFDSQEREDWSYVPRSRAGLALGDMTDAQRSAAHALIGAGLSPRGHDKVKGILLIEPILGQIEGNPDFRDPGRYHVAVFGRPGAAGPWGWRFEGHHLSLNFTHAGGRVATTPAFLGANPARVGTGKHKGLRVLAAEEDLGRALLASLTDEQRRRAVLSASAPSDIVTETSRRVSLPRFEGLPAAQMTAEQRAALQRLIEVYVGNLQPDLAREHLDRMEAAGLDKIHFAWAGSAAPGQSHYYRVHGPTHVIELDNRGGNHIHTVLRDLEHDFGDGLLAEHLRDHHRGGKVVTRPGAGGRAPR
jgi:Protein of unknown function (DUF3500)